MRRLNDSKRWMLVADHFKNAYFTEKGICIFIRSMEQDHIISSAVVERMEAQLWRAARTGKLRGVNAHAVSEGCGYLWTPRDRKPRIAAARKLSRLVKR